MKKIILFSFLFIQMGNATEPKYIFKSWCKGLKDNEVFKYVKDASDFVGIDPLHLTVGMSGEGFSEKHDYPKKCRVWPKFNDDKTLELKTCDDNDVLHSSIVQPDDIWKLDKKTDEWKSVGQNYDGYAVVEAAYYGGGFNDDGSDTFCLEASRLRKEGLFPAEFSIDDLGNLSKYDSLKDAPDVACDDTGRVNESATMRFTKSSMDLPYSKRWRVPSNETQGDEGQAHYKTAEAQTYVNAAMWKDAEQKFDKAFDEVKEQYPAIKGKNFTKYEKIFWHKVFYNGGQGTQAAAYFMLKRYAKSGYLKDDAYLKTRPTNSYRQLYINGRRDVDSYRYAEEIKCPGTWPESGSPKKTKISDLKNDEEGSTQSESVKLK